MTQIVRALMALEAAMLFGDSVQHLGIPLFGLPESHVWAAAFVEGACGVALVIAIRYRDAGPPVMLAAHAAAIAGVLLGTHAAVAAAAQGASVGTAHHQTLLIALLVTATMVLTDRRGRPRPSATL